MSVDMSSSLYLGVVREGRSIGTQNPSMARGKLFVGGFGDCSLRGDFSSFVFLNVYVVEHVVCIRGQVLSSLPTCVP